MCLSYYYVIIKFGEIEKKQKVGVINFFSTSLYEKKGSANLEKDTRNFIFIFER
jgi:hypothetical protein